MEEPPRRDQPAAPDSDEIGPASVPPGQGATSPSHPSHPSYPAYPAYPGYPAYPAAPGYASYPSAPLYPSYRPAADPSTMPSVDQPTYPGYAPPAGYAPYPSYSSYPSYAPPAEYAPYSDTLAARAPSGPPFLARPLSRPASGLLFAGALVAVLGMGALGLSTSGGDWGSGVFWAGSISLALAVLWLIAIGIRAALGRRARGGLLLGLPAIVVFASVGAMGLIVPNPLRMAQAQGLEASHDWARAVREYQLAGQQAPASHDLARVFDEWGEELARQQQYAQAIVHLQIVVTTYPRAAAEDQRAWTDLIRTYTAWFGTNSSTIPYANVLSDLTGYQQATDCDAGCQTSVSALIAQARYQYGEQLVAKQQYGDAITQFELITSALPKSPYAARARAAAASAYYALGQSQLTSDCPAALAAYQTLVSKYSDTPEAGKAKAALAAPVDVTGVLSNYPSSQPPTMYLSKHVWGNPATGTYSNDYQTSVGGGGRFTFHQVQQDKYNLSALRPDGSGVYWLDPGSGNLYTIVVGPLCALDIGTYTF